ncbi:Myb-like DNA-binding domain containing protein [Tritrichomonas foetus]|uniref:Myb-like DNA-binding domain containing protein n=1 Tax=Tritrichomonas foetus TaxID=1144522 RepID=A0A1J4JZT6_9EUKA|nr:Myb-like DNA-binding domain containing protein [Tritrichomonas foetus]|eukprot:OHT03006.1 Myb-like DNA-binding domain containing protein [Tritrichomonas foetus]
MEKATRRKFSYEEDNIIKEYTQKYGEDWEAISIQLVNRTPKQCHDQYNNYLREDLTSKPWTLEEDAMLIKLRKEIGPKWVKMTMFLQGRSGNDIKNRWHKHLVDREPMRNVALNQPSKCPSCLTEETPNNNTSKFQEFLDQEDWNWDVGFNETDHSFLFSFYDIFSFYS